jgi:RNA polymerase sigma factor (sigma-70 family)
MLMADDGTAGAEDFVALRSLLFSLAYRMTGSVADAEDIVSDAYLRLRRAQAAGTQISSLKSYLSSVVTRLSIDHLRSARMRREAYVGPWLPEPLVRTDTTPESERVELADTLSMAFLVLLETLSPTERAVFLLREVFEFDYPQIAGILDKTEPYCRQLMHRARQHVDVRKPRFDAGVQERTNSRPGSSPPSRTAISTRSSRCSPLTSWPTATVAATARRCPGRSTAGTRCSGCWRRSAGPPPNTACTSSRCRSTGSPAHCSSTPTAGC